MTSPSEHTVGSAPLGSSVPVSLGTQLTERARRHPLAPAVTCRDTTVTYGELESMANRLARWFEELGVSAGGTVTIGLPNGVPFLATAFACWKLGAVPQPVSHRLPAGERRAIVELAAPQLVVGVAEEVAGARSVPIDAEPPSGLSDAPHPDRISDSWKIMTSGGSTGRPKLIVSGTDSTMDPHCGDLLGIADGGVVHAPGPLYHNTPFVASVTALLLGNHLIMSERFDAADTLDAIETHRAEVLTVVPTMMQRILRHLDQTGRRPDLGSLRAVWHMGASCPPQVKRGWLELVGPHRLWELYGGTEYVAITTIRGDEWLTRPGSVGRPYFGDIRVLRADGEPAAPGEVGEIYMRPAPGARRFRYIGAEAGERDGWVTIGDLGHQDEDGYLYISDRRTDMIVAGGANIFPAEVEAALLEHPAVLSVVVVGLPHHDLGQVAHAVVQAAGPVTEAELTAHLAERLVRYKQPRSYHFVDQDLRDEAGKTRRTAVLETEIHRLGLTSRT